MRTVPAIYIEVPVDPLNSYWKGKQCQHCQGEFLKDRFGTAVIMHITKDDWAKDGWARYRCPLHERCLAIWKNRSPNDHNCPSCKALVWSNPIFLTRRERYIQQLNLRYIQPLNLRYIQPLKQMSVYRDAVAGMILVAVPSLLDVLIGKIWADIAAGGLLLFLGNATYKELKKTSKISQQQAAEKDLKSLSIPIMCSGAGGLISMRLIRAILPIGTIGAALGGMMVAMMAGAVHRAAKPTVSQGQSKEIFSRNDV